MILAHPFTLEVSRTQSVVARQNCDADKVLYLEDSIVQVDMSP